jgi:hypothetical protein
VSFVTECIARGVVCYLDGAKKDTLPGTEWMP